MGGSKRAGTGPSAGSTSSQVSRVRRAGETRARSGKSCSSARCAAIRGMASRPRAASGRSMSFVASGDVALPWRRSIRRRIAIPRANSRQDAVSSGRCKPGEPSQARQEARSCRAQNPGGNMFRSITDEVAWVTGAGSGIGQAGAVSLAKAGARLVLSGRRTEPLEETAGMIRAAGGTALVRAAAKRIEEEFGRCDILVNSAGVNVKNRSWSEVDPEGFDTVVEADLSGPFYACAAVLPMMRAQEGGLIIHISSWAGRYVSRLTGPAYSAAKHGLVALSESLNQEECRHGIRSCCICPGEVATPILDKRPVPVTAEDKARMLQSEDLAETILFVARLPVTVCMNEILISPTWNRGYIEGVKL